jgi:beta-phosphoglucomutase-like phosphatase (HAD superfamily)
MIKAFLFDLDGTLQDTEVLYVKAWQRAYQDRDCLVSHDEACEIVYGRAKDEVYELFRSRIPQAYPDLESIEEPLARHFNALCSMQDIRIPGSIELLDRLAEKYPVAIVSGNSRRKVSEAITTLDIGAKVAFFLGCEDYTPGKPDPACFLLAAQQLHIPPSQCLVFEDSEAGVRAAKEADMTCIALNRPGTPNRDLSQADHILANLAEYNPTVHGPGAK